VALQTSEPAFPAACPLPLSDVALLFLDIGLRLGDQLGMATGWPGTRTRREVRVRDCGRDEGQEPEVSERTFERAGRRHA